MVIMDSKDYTDSTFEGKSEFVNDLSKLVRRDSRSGVLYISYKEENHTEIVTIHYKGGSDSNINVTHNSNGAIFLEVAREVYGSGAHGKIREF